MELILIVVDVLGMVPKGLNKGLEQLALREDSRSFKQHC